MPERVCVCDLVPEGDRDGLGEAVAVGVCIDEGVVDWLDEDVRVGL